MSSRPDNPYVGPRTFEAEDREYFFGREKEARDLVSFIISEPLVLFYATSGAGKSSLLNTKIAPGLADEGFIVLPIGRVGGSLPEGIDEVENIFSFNLLSSIDDEKTPLEALAEMSLSDYLKGQREENGKEPQPRVLIIDQFEEIVTTNLEHWRNRRSFFVQLRQAMLDDPMLWVVLTLREDNIANLDPYADILPGKLRARFYMQRMRAQAALNAIEKPAEQAGRPFAPGVAIKLVDNLCQIRTEGPEENPSGEFVEPVQLQVVCYQLWENLRKGEFKPEITEDDLRVAGDVDTALADFYERAVGEVIVEAHQQGIQVSENYVRDWFETQLITEAATRGVVYQGTEATAGLQNEVVSLLQNQYLIRAEKRAGGCWYELVHDRFIYPILQANHIWLVRQGPLTRSAHDWSRSGKKPEKLLAGESLANALREAEGKTLSPLVVEFLEESDRREKAAKAEQRAKRFRQIVAGLTIGMVVILAVLGWVTFAMFEARASEKNAKASELTAEADAEKAFIDQFRAEVDATRAFRDKEIAQTAEAEARTQADLGATREAIAATRAAEAEVAYAEALKLNQQTILARSAAEASNANLAVLLALEALRPEREAEAAIQNQALTTLRARLLNTFFGEPLPGHEAGVGAVAFSPDGITMASGDGTGAIRLWDVANYRELGEPLVGHEGSIRSMAFSPDGSILASAGNDGSIILWHVATRAALGEPLIGHEGSVQSVAFSPDGAILASGGVDEKVILWDVATQTALGEPLVGHEGSVQSVAFSPDGFILASGGADNRIYLWDVTSQAALGEPLEGHEKSVQSVAFSPDGYTLISGSADNTILLWDNYIDQPISTTLRGHTGPVNAVAVSPDGHSLASASDDDTIILWDLLDRARDQTLTGHKNDVWSVAFSPDGKTLVSGSFDNQVILWEVPLSSTVIDVQSGAMYSVDFEPQNQILATAGSDRVVHVWYAADGLAADAALAKELLPPVSTPSTLFDNFLFPQALEFSPDGKKLALAPMSDDDAVWIWDITQEPIEVADSATVISGHEGGVSGLSFSPDGQTLATASLNEIYLWDLGDNNAKRRTLLGHEADIGDLEFSPDGRSLASGDVAGQILIWDMEDLEAEPRHLAGHREWVNALDFRPDGQLLASGGDDDVIRLWDVATGRAIGNPLEGHTSNVNAVRFSPDGQSLASASQDAAIMLWDVSNPDDVAFRTPVKFEGHFDQVWSVAFGLEGESLISVSLDGTTRLWSIGTVDELNELACVRAGRNLSYEEWDKYFFWEEADETYKRTCESWPFPDDLLERARELARNGNAQAAVDYLKRILALDAEVGSDAEAEAKRLVAPALVDEAWNLIGTDGIGEAVEQIALAQEYDPALKIPAELWLSLCQAGIDAESLALARGACEQAVADVVATDDLYRNLDLCLLGGSDSANLFRPTCGRVVELALATEEINPIVDACWRLGTQNQAENEAFLPVCERAVALANESDDVNGSFQVCKLGELVARVASAGGACERAAALARPMTMGQVVNGQIEFGGTELWVFEGQEGQTISIRMDKAESGLDSIATLFMGDGVILAEDDQSGGDNNALICGFPLPETGRYFIQTSGYQGSVGAYELELSTGACP